MYFQRQQHVTYDVNVTAYRLISLLAYQLNCAFVISLKSSLKLAISTSVISQGCNLLKL